MTDSSRPEPHGPSVFERAVALLLAIALIAIMSFVIISKDVTLDGPKARLAMVMMALLAGAVGAMLPGLLNLQYSGNGATIRAVGGGAFFLIVLYFGMSVPEGGPLAGGRDRSGPAAEASALGGGDDVWTAIADWLELQEEEARPDGYGSDYRGTGYGNAAHTAIARCSLTGATGRGSSPDPWIAQDLAIEGCYANGGAPGCCVVVSAGRN